MTEQALRIGALLLALASAETLHGIARTTLLVPRVGKRAAQRIGIVTGSLLAFCLCLLMVPAIGITGTGGLLALGALLAVFMASFDLALERLVLKRPWSKALADLDPRSGNLLLFGLLFLVVCPYLSMKLGT